MVLAAVAVYGWHIENRTKQANIKQTKEKKKIRVEMHTKCAENEMNKANEKDVKDKLYNGIEYIIECLHKTIKPFNGTNKVPK